MYYQWYVNFYAQKHPGLNVCQQRRWKRGFEFVRPTAFDPGCKSADFLVKCQRPSKTNVGKPC